MIRNLMSWMRNRKERRERAARAASLAVQLVCSGCLAPPRLVGTRRRVAA